MKSNTAIYFIIIIIIIIGILFFICPWFLFGSHMHKFSVKNI
jgi:hypothetical protein